MFLFNDCFHRLRRNNFCQCNRNKNKFKRAKREREKKEILF